MRLAFYAGTILMVAEGGSSASSIRGVVDELRGHSRTADIFQCCRSARRSTDSAGTSIVSTLHQT